MSAEKPESAPSPETPSQPEASSSPEPQPEAQPAPAPAPRPAGGDGESQFLTLPEVIKQYEQFHNVDLNDSDNRVNLLRQLKDGAFPAPIKPDKNGGKLPRTDARGEIDWSQCLWLPNEINEWLEKGKANNREQWEEGWKRPGFKPWRDFGSLASFVARRREPSGEAPWVHWEDRYRPRAFAGSLIFRFSLIAALGWFFALFLPQTVGQPELATDAEGNPVVAEGLFEMKNGETAVRVQDRSNNDQLVFVNWRAHVEPANRVNRNGSWFTTDDDTELRTFYDPITGENVFVRPSDVVSSEQLVMTTADDGSTAPKPVYRKKVTQNDDDEFLRTVDGADTPIDNFSVDGEGGTATLTDTQYRTLLQQDPKFEYSFFSFLTATLSFFPGSVNLLILLVLIAIIALPALYRFSYNLVTMRYKMDDTLLNMQEGILNHKDTQVRLIHIQDMAVDQGPLQRVLNVGSITIHAPDDVDSPELHLYGVRDPRAVKDRIYQVSETAKKTHGYYFEAGQGGRGKRGAGAAGGR